MRVIKGRALNLSHTFMDETEENPLTLTAVTVSLQDSLGAEVANAAATQGTGGEWTVSFPAQPLGEYTAIWDGGTATDETNLEVVGGYMFTVPQARNSDEYLNDKTAFPASEIVEYREVVEQEFERITGRSFTTRVVDKTFMGDGSQEYVALVPDAQDIEAAYVNEVQVTDLTGWSVSRLGKVTVPSGAVLSGDLLRVRYRYGFKVPPADVARVGMVRVRSLMAAEDSGIPDRATTWQPAEGGTFRLATPGQGKWRTGIPEVDSTLANYALDTVLAVYGVG